MIRSVKSRIAVQVLIVSVFFQLVAFELDAQTRYWVSGVAANWSGDNWASSSGGATDGGGPPTALQNARFDANGLGNCNVDVAGVSISGLVLSGYTGVIDINGNTFTTSGTVTLSSGSINDGLSSGSFAVNSAGTTTLNGTSFGASTNVTSANILLSGSTFNAVSSFTKNGSGGNTGSGGNVYNAAVTFTHSGAGGNWIMANTNPDDFNGTTTVSNTGTGAIYMSHAASGNTYDSNLVINQTSGSLIYFGNAGGTSTLAALMTVTIGGGGFTTGTLRFRNFTQTGATAQSLILTGTGYLDIYDCSWGGAVTFTAPQIATRGTTYSGVASLTKTGATSNSSAGGNVFQANTTINNSGSGYVLMGNGSPDTFNLDLNMNNTGTHYMYLAYNSADNYVGGDLTVVNSASGTTTNIQISDQTASTLTVAGATSLTNSTTSTTGNLYLGNNGDVTLTGGLTAVNSATGTTGQIIIGQGTVSAVSIGGAASITNSGNGATTTRVFIGNNGDVTFNNTLSITNSSNSTNSQVFCNYGSSSQNTYNGNITLESTHADCDGILFGNNGGSAILAATRTVAIGGGGFIGQNLYFRNFNQTGATAQALSPTGTALLTIYDCAWGGDIAFDAPRFTTRGTTYSGTANLTKNGATNDASAGGNIFEGNTTILNSGTGILYIGNGSPDTFRLDLAFTNSGTSYSYLAHAGAGHYVGGNLTIIHSTTGATTEFRVCQGGGTTITVDGATSITNSSSSTTNNIYFPITGTATLNGSLTLNNASTGTSGQIILANNATATTMVAGAATVTNSGSGTTKRTYLGNQGDVTFGSTLAITNSSTATNSEVFCNYNSNSSNTYNGNITVEAPNANCDGVYFGSSAGTGTLAATRTVTIIGAGFLARNLYFRNFTQAGATAQALAPTGTAYLTMYDCSWGGDVVFTAPQFASRGTTYSGTASITKNGATNNVSVGGNVFEGNTTILNSSTALLYMGNSSPDTFRLDLSYTNSGTGSSYLAHNSAGNYVGGSLTIVNSASGATTDFRVCEGATATLTVDGATSITNSTSSTSGSTYIPLNGTATLNGSLSLVNSSTGATGQISVANGANSTSTIAGATTVSNSGAGTTKRIYLGSSGDITFNGTLAITNTSTATNSEVFCNYATNSNNQYNGNITLESTNANCDGIYFGSNTGTGTLAATRTVTIVGGGFFAANLYFRNFTQVGATAQALAPTGTTIMNQYDCNWGGDVVFSSPRFYTRGTTYGGTASITKTGATDDASAGGNVFDGNTTLTNSGSGYFLMGNGTQDTFRLDLDITNSGTRHFYLGYNSAGNYVGGNLTAVNSGTGTSSNFHISDLAVSSLQVDGNVTVTNSSTANATALYLGNSGDVTIGGGVTATNSSASAGGYLYVANGTASVVTIGGATSLTHSGSGTTNRSYLGNSGDVTFNGTLMISNSCTATNSQIYCNDASTSVNAYNQDIVLENTNAASDGILFGNGSGSGTLAATRTVTIGGGGFIAGELRFRNFTQVGATAQALAATGTTYMLHYDSDWGGDVVFSAPRMYTRGSTYRGTASLTKTGAVNDASVGGNVFMGNTTLTNTGSGYFLMGNGSPDSFNLDLDVINSGTYYFYLAHAGAGHYVGGDLTWSHAPAGTSTISYVCQNASSSLIVDGVANFSNAATSTTAGSMTIGDQGDITFNDSLIVSSTASSTTTSMSIGNNTSSTIIVAGPAVFSNSGSGTTHRFYVGNSGDISFGGVLVATNNSSATTGEMYIANSTNSAITVAGNTTITNSGAATTKRTYLGNSGDMTFNGTLTISNSSSATNSQVYCNNSSNSSNLYNDNIILESTNASSDGIFFGSGAGTGTLAATRTVTIGGGGFIAGTLNFRNFTQTGATAQSLTLTGTGFMVQYDASWGGDVTFVSPSFTTRGTTYSGTSYIEKNGTTSDASVGGNTFTGNSQLLCTGSGYFLMGNGSPDVFGANLDITNSGSFNFYLAHSSAGNTVAGDLTVTNSATGASTYVYLCTASASTLTVTGNATISNIGSSSNCRTYVGDQGDITFNGDLTLNHSPSGSTGYFYVGNNANSSVSVAGVTRYTHSGAGTTKQSFIGNNGDVTFNDSLYITNTSTATNSQAYFNHSSNSSNTYNGDIVLSGTDANSDGIFFGASAGTGTLAAGQTVSISGTYQAQQLYFRNFTQAGATAQSLSLSGTSLLTIYNSNWGGDVTFDSPRLNTRGSIYSGTTSLEKTGATNDAMVGGNTFNGVTTFTNSGTGYFLFGNGTADDHNNDVTYVKNSTGLMYPSYNSTSTYAGNINFDLNTAVTFAAAGAARVELDGTAAQSINDVGASVEPTFRRLTLNNANDEITLNTPITVSLDLTFTQGNINTTDVNLLTMNDNSTVTGVSNNSYVRGPIEKIGNDAFTFPVGDSSIYRPISISAPSSGAARFKAEYHATNPWPTWDGGSKAISVDHVSSREYWILERTASTSSAVVTLSWDTNSGGVDALGDLKVVRWGTGQWNDQGNGGTTGDVTSGTVASSGAITSFSPFTLGSSNTNNPLPIELLSFSATYKGDVVDVNWTTSTEIENDFFTVERSVNGELFEDIAFVDGAGNSNKTLSYNSVDREPLSGISYYRLKQTDFDGTFTYSKVVAVENHSMDEHSISVYPNPGSGELLYIASVGLPENAEITIYDISGKLWHSEVVNGSNRDVWTVQPEQKLSQGIYTVTITTENNRSVKRLIVR